MVDKDLKRVDSQSSNRKTLLCKISLWLIGCFFIVTPHAQEINEELLTLSLEDLMKVKVSVASNVSSTNLDTPASTTKITEQQILLSGARTLNELLTIYVPGFFLVEDQDDTIAGFRGVVPDNNSKTLLLINGVSVNADWVWGAPDAVLNSIDMDYVKEIEVIRGPGSVTLGQGALIGVINIVTKKVQDAHASVNLTIGEDGLSKFWLETNFKMKRFKGQVFVSKGEFDGSVVSNIGWASSRVDQGLSVYERQHHLKRSKYQNLVLSLDYERWSVDAFRFEQERDLYNFYRDREIVAQRLDTISLERQFKISQDAISNLSVYLSRDDYQLKSHGFNLRSNERLEFESTSSGFSTVAQSTEYLPDQIVEPGLVLGGTREERTGIKNIFSFRQPKLGNNIALGVEWQSIEMGKQNYAGDNFIVNEVVQLSGIAPSNNGFSTGHPLNEINTWVKPKTVTIKSLFLEDHLKLNPKWSIFGAFRYDDHSEWGSQATPRIGAFFRPDDKQTYRISFQSGFRGAVGVQFAGGFVQDGFLAQSNFDDLNAIAGTIADFDFDGDGTNDSRVLNDLKPEQLETIEFVARYNRNNGFISGTYFYNVITDVISASANGYDGLSYGDAIGDDIVGTWNGNWYYQNRVGKLEQQGAELEFYTRFEKANVKWELSISHSLVKIVDYVRV